MGDRANIYIVQHDKQDSGIYLYTHWGGYELPKTLALALERGQSRWDDEAYLGQIIFSEMVKDDINGVTGVGITTYRTDNEHPILVVDAETKTVGFAKEGQEPKTYESYSFPEYVAKYKNGNQDDESDDD